MCLSLSGSGKANPVSAFIDQQANENPFDKSGNLDAGLRGGKTAIAGDIEEIWWLEGTGLFIKLNLNTAGLKPVWIQHIATVNTIESHELEVGDTATFFGFIASAIEREEARTLINRFGTQAYLLGTLLRHYKPTANAATD